MNTTTQAKYVKYLLYNPCKTGCEVLNDSFLSEEERIIGRIEPEANAFFSFVKDIPHLPMDDVEFNKVIQLTDYILAVNLSHRDYSILLSLAAKVNLPVMFTSAPDHATSDLCRAIDVKYELLNLNETEDIKIPCVNVYGISLDRGDELCVNISLKIASELTRRGYSVGFRTNYDALKLLNRTSCPDIIINLLASRECNEDATLYVADVQREDLEEINDFANNLNAAHSKLIIVHDYKKRINHPHVFYLNFFNSDLSSILNYIKDYFPSLRNIDLCINRTKRLYLKNKDSVCLYEFDCMYYMLFSALRKTISLSKEEYNVLSQFVCGSTEISCLDSEKLLCFLERVNRWMVDNETEEKKILFRLSLSPVFVNNNMYTISFVGNGVCNMHCKYCFSDHNSTQFKGKDLPVEIMDKALALVCNRFPRPEHICVDFMIGSEPLTNFEDYVKLVEICRHYGEYKKINIQLGFLTNGIQLTDNILQLFNEDLRWMGFSIDGDKKTHDTMRTLRNGEGTYDIILEKVQKVLAFGWECPPGVSVVITSNNLNVLQIFKHLWEVGFRVIISRPVRAGKEQYYSINDENIDSLEDSYFAFSQFLLEKLKKHQLEFLKAILFDTDYFGRFLIRVIHNTRIFVKHCGAGESILSIRNDGSIYSCDSLNALGVSYVGDVQKGIRAKYVLEYVTEADNCKTCPFRFLCGGPCNHLKYLDQRGDVLNIECRLIKFLIKLSISFWEQASEYLSEDELQSIVAYISKCNNMRENPDSADNLAYGPR